MITAAQQLSHSKYRSDIDGLRAIAVLSVVAFHAFPAWVKGGFIGVDVFFVISGFLISKIIFQNLENGEFGLLNFYSRRILRIFPALLIMLVSSYALGWFILLADEYKQLGKHITASAGFLSNFALWRESGYFDNSSETKPLLHLWSLGIEEQFYIAFPIFLWLAWRNKFWAITLVLTFFFTSFYLNFKGATEDDVAAFYSPQTRFWELLSGTILAWFSLYKKDVLLICEKIKISSAWKDSLTEHFQKHALILSNFFSLAGFLLLAYGFLKIDGDIIFPGKWATIPVLGSALIILGGPKAWINLTILSNKIFIWFGLISFPLYLWHWPLLSFARIIEGAGPSRGVRVTAILLSITLAWLTYKFVEIPVRSGKGSNIRPIALIVLLAIAGYIGYKTHELDGLPFREVVTINGAIKSGLAGGDQGNSVNKCGVKPEETRRLFGICAQDKRGNVRFALMGDSKAAALFPGLVRTSSDSGRWMIIGGNGPNGAPIPLLSAYPDPNRILTNIGLKAIIENRDIEVVALASAIRAIFKISDRVESGRLATYNHRYLDQLPSSSRFNEALRETKRLVELLVSAGKIVVLVVDNPALPDPKDCINRQTSSSLLNSLLVPHRESAGCTVRLSDFKGKTKIYHELLSNVQNAFPDSVRIFDPTNIYCNPTKGTCEAIRDSRPLYSYTDHISDYASGLVGERLNNFILSNQSHSL